MPVECFVDTNVLVYAAAGRGAEDAKRQRALALIEEADLGLSAQVLQEFFVTVVHKIKKPLTAAQAIEWIDELEIFPCLPIDAAVVKLAVVAAARYRISYWNAAIVTAAQEMGARTLYSEDLGNGQRFGSLTVVNPFTA
jgi:predicted nucleic acid-binding protein